MLPVLRRSDEFPWVTGVLDALDAVRLGAKADVRPARQDEDAGRLAGPAPGVPAQVAAP